VKFAIRWAVELVHAYPDMHDTAQDEIVTALLLHDLLKNGKASSYDKKPKNITATHGVLLAAEIAQQADKLSEQEERILVAIAGHMGVWTEPFHLSCWDIKDEKARKIAEIVHLADYIASRFVEEFIEQSKPTHCSKESKQETTLQNGKSLNKMYPEDSIPYQFSLTLFKMIQARQPGYYKRYTEVEGGVEYFVQKEAYYFDLLIRKDGKDLDEIVQVLEWSQEDPFWRNNIKSGYKFREQYDRLLQEMKEKGMGSFSDDPYPALTKKLIRQYSRLTNNKDFVPSPSQYTKFVETTKKMVEFFKNRYKDMSEDMWVTNLADCLEKNFIDKGEILYPGHFCSDTTWDILVPQYFAELGIG